MSSKPDSGWLGVMVAVLGLLAGTATLIASLVGDRHGVSIVMAGLSIVVSILLGVYGLRRVRSARTRR